MGGEKIVTKYTTTEDIVGPIRLTRAGALHRVAVFAGGTLLDGHGGVVYQFPSLAAADEAKAVLDALDPDCTGAVFHTGRLVLMPNHVFDDELAALEDDEDGEEE